MIIQTTVIGALVAALALLVALPASAADGAILIDQSKINAGGITPGDAPGFPATLSRTGRYKLTGNIIVPAGQTGIRVTQDDVTIDLNGFSISGSPPDQAVTGIDAESVNGVRVANGTIAGFGTYAVSIGAFAIVENMRLRFTGSGAVFQIGVGGGREARIRNNTIANGRYGVWACHECLIEQNLISGSLDYGILVSGGVVLGNIVDFGLETGADTAIGYGNNVLFNSEVYDQILPLHPNVCEPACP